MPDGESASCTPATPYTFDGYWKLPEKTAEAFRGDYCTVGDMARRDEDGYIYLVDRKSNMIISGGENIYPSEVESAARRASEGEGRGGHRRARREMGRARARGHRAARRRDASTEAEIARLVQRQASPATSGRARSRSSTRTRCRAPRPARFSIAVLRAQHGGRGRTRGSHDSDPTNLRRRRGSRAFSSAAASTAFSGLQGGHIQPIWDYVAR